MGHMSKQDKAHLRSGAWYKTVNDPIPEHVKQQSSASNPFANGFVLNRTPDVADTAQPTKQKPR